MAAVTRVHPPAGAGSGYDHGEQSSVANLKCVELDAGETLAAKDTLGGFIETMVREFAPLMYESTGTNGKIFMIVDGHGQTATSMTTSLQCMGTIDSIATGSLVFRDRTLSTFKAGAGA